MAVGDTYTSPFGTTTQGNQVQQAVSTLSGMGQIANPIQGFQQASQAQSQAIAGQQGYLNNQAQGLMTASQIPQLSGQMGLDYNTFTQMLANDPAGQRHLDPSYATSQPSNSFTLPGGIQVPGVVSALPQQTLANVSDPYKYATSPQESTGLSNLEAGGMLQTLNKLSGAIGNNLSTLQSQLTSNAGTYSTQIQLLGNLADRYMQLANYHLSLQQAGLAASPLSGGISALSGLDSSGLTKSQIRKIYQSYWNNALTTAQQDTISKAFKNRFGQSLNPQPLPPAEADKVNSTYTTLDTVNNVINYLKTHKNAPAGVTGTLQESLVKLGLGTSIDPQTRQYLADLTSISGGGERQLIGGRLTGYLLNRLGIAFPTVKNSPVQNLSILTKLRKELINDLKTYSENQGYDSYASLPGGEPIQSAMSGDAYTQAFSELKKKNPKMATSKIDEFLQSQGYISPDL